MLNYRVIYENFKKQSLRSAVMDHVAQKLTIDLLLEIISEQETKIKSLKSRSDAREDI